MAKKTPYQRAEFLLLETEKRLQEVEKLDLDKAETETRTQWLEARRYELKNILTFAGAPDIQLRRTALQRILALEKDAWDAGLHNRHVKTEKPKI